MAISGLTPNEILKTLSFGLLGSSDTPKPPGTESLDPYGQKSLQTLSEDAGRTPEEIASSQMKGTQVGAQTLDRGLGRVAQQTSSLGGDTASMSRALDRRATNLYNQNQSLKNAQVKLDAPVQSIQRQSNLLKVLTNQARMNAEQARQNQEFARQVQNNKNQMIGQLFSTAGTIGGFMIGGPAGGMIGGQVAGGVAPQQQAQTPSSRAYQSSYLTDFSSKNRF